MEPAPPRPAGEQRRGDGLPVGPHPGWRTRIGGRYMGAERAEAYGRRNAVPPEMVVRVRVEHVLAKVDIAD